MPPPLCYCRTVRRDTRKPHFPNKSPHGSSRAREQTTETPSTEATPEHPPGLLQRASAISVVPDTPHRHPTRRSRDSSYRTPIRYPHHPVLPHPDAVSMVGPGVGTPSTTDRLDVRAYPPTVTPPWIPVSTGKTKEVVVVPHSNAVPTPPSSYRTPMRYPWWGKRGWAHMDTRTVPPHPSSPTPIGHPGDGRGYHLNPHINGHLQSPPSPNPSPCSNARYRRAHTFPNTPSVILVKTGICGVGAGWPGCFGRNQVWYDAAERGCTVCRKPDK